MAKQVDFETSAELKRLFSRELETWRSRNRLSLDDLSARCGVSPSYLSHIGRYGRIPSKPVLLLLALNFGMQDPREFFQAANVDEPWPFDDGALITKPEQSANGFLSVKLDMAGLAEAIQSVVRAELRPRTLKDLLNGRPLRIGLNPTQPWLFELDDRGQPNYKRGLLPDLCAYLENSLRSPIETSVVDFDGYIDALRTGEIDLFGPMLSTPHAPSNILFSLPINRIGMSALMRTRECPGLATLPPPKRFEDLKDTSYQIAVMRNSRAHLIANTRLNRPNETLVICSAVEEALDRLTVRGVARPVHFFICSSMNAKRHMAMHPGAFEILFDTPSTMIDIGDNAFAIRPDWPEVVPTINHAISFIMNSGGFARTIRSMAEEYGPGIFEPVWNYPRAGNE
jgi:ABC-type amino acid transport substrate-binding protein